ncbi:MAG TPA: TOBE domain-containing protein [Solirubrobacteraceae bacterium]|nr:TOBE domain-containing protein [Solirubrobacteraceae bacterium]
MPISARNQIKGTITKVTRGEAIANVEVDADGVRIVASITVEAVDELDPLRASLRDRFGYEAHFTHHAIVGTCPRCAVRDRNDASFRLHQNAGAEERSGGSAHAHPRGGPRGEQLDHAHEHSHGDYVHSHTHAERG